MKSDMENRDWLNDYMSLKQVSKTNPFIVPDGYFDDLTDRIVSYKNVVELINEDSQHGFVVPENYFEELTGNIQRRINIESAVNNEHTGFIVPDAYFENLEQQIQSRIFVEETLAGSPAGFTIPENYFDKLNKSILDKTVDAENAGKKGIVRKMFASTAFKYATAACFAVAIGGGILINQLSAPTNDHQKTFLHKELSTVPVDDIKAYLELNVDAGDTQQTVLSDNVPVDDNSLKDALQNDADSAQ